MNSSPSSGGEREFLVPPPKTEALLWSRHRTPPLVLYKDPQDTVAAPFFSGGKKLFVAGEISPPPGDKKDAPADFFNVAPHVGAKTHSPWVKPRGFGTGARGFFLGRGAYTKESFSLRKWGGPYISWAGLPP